MHENLEEASSRRSAGRLSVLAGVDGRAKNVLVDFLRGLALSVQEAEPWLVICFEILVGPT